jgi:hypothetical protein
MDLAVVNAQASTTGLSRILANFLGVTPEGRQVGVTLYAREGKISELEVSSMDERVRRSRFKIETLNPFDRPKDWASAYRHVGNPGSQFTIIPFIRR